MAEAVMKLEGVAVYLLLLLVRPVCGSKREGEEKHSSSDSIWVFLL